MIRLHQRMGHSPFDLLRTCYPLLFHGISADQLFCEAYHVAKLRQTSYKSLDDQCYSPFDCIHNNIWGPCPVESLTGCQFFVVFVDDYSQTMWLHLLKTKGEGQKIIIQFCEMIYNYHLGKRIKRFRSDNGTEFLNSEVRSYFIYNDIIHESSCLNTPQQNGLAERRLGYTLATARSLLFQANMTKKYLGGGNANHFISHKSDPHEGD